MNFVLDPSLVLYVPLYELDGASFASKDAYGHTCTVTRATWGMQGRTFSTALTSDIDVGSSILGGLSAFSILLWVKSTTADAAQYAYSGRYGRLGVHSDNKITLDHWDGTAEVIGYSTNTIGGDGNFHSIVGTCVSGGVGKIYLDGTQNGNNLDLSGQGAWASTVNEKIGKAAWIGANYWNGIIGEVSLYNRALTPQEIQRNYLATKWRYR